MPRDAAATRESLIAAGRLLLSRPGGLSTPMRQIVEAAGQRNESALHYHFGGRQGLLDAIIEVHNSRIEDARASILDAAGPDPSLRRLVEAVIGPQVELLEEPEGRQFLSVVSQLTDLFDRWDEPGSSAPPQALRALRAIESRLPAELTRALRRERITRFLELVAGALGARARQLDGRRPPGLSTSEFAGNLVAMTLGALQAPASPASRTADSF